MWQTSPLPVGVEGEGQVAARALQAVAALAAEDIGGRAAPVEKQDRLLVGIQHLAQRFLQLAAEDGAVAGFQLLAHIHNLDRRQVELGCRKAAVRSSFAEGCSLRRFPAQAAQ